MKTIRNLTCGMAVLLSTTAVHAQDDLTMTMNWTADSAHLGFAYAFVNGYYDDAGLNVTLEEGRGSSVTSQLVATGQSELGLADAGAALNVASQGAPIRVIATIWKSSQHGVQSLASADITQPSDLRGRSIGVAPGTAMVPLMRLFLQANGIGEDEVEIVSANQAALLNLLATGQIDAIAETPENTVVPLAAEGIAVDNMYFYEHGVPVVSLSLVAREDRLTQNGDAYARFVDASLRGWRGAMEDPEAAVEALLELFPETENSREALLQGATYSFSSVCPGGQGDHIGATSDETWASIFEVMTTVMEFPSEPPITHYYTLDYLPADPVICP